MHGQTVVITGGNSGIGKETARQLALAGAQIVLACRNIGAATRLAEELRASCKDSRIEVVGLDLNSFSSIRECVSKIMSLHDGIDVLINNAGTYVQGDTLTEDGLNCVMQTNYLGPFLLTLLLLPALAARAPSRVVNVTSAMYRIGHLNLDAKDFLTRRDGFAAYSASKLALLLFTREFPIRFPGMGISANALHPGLVDTKIMTLGKWYDVFIRAYMSLNAIDTQEGAKTSLHLATSLDVEGMTGKYFVRSIEHNPVLSERTRMLGSQLWEKTLKKVDPQGRINLPSLPDRLP